MVLEFTPLLAFNLFGCCLSLFALFLGQTKLVDTASLKGLALNGVSGFILAAGACYGVLSKQNLELLPWAVLNGIWSLISVVTFFYRWSKCCQSAELLPVTVVLSAETLPVAAVRMNPLKPLCEHEDATWKAKQRDDGKWEWESHCELCGIQKWHMREAWSKQSDEEGNLIRVQRWHAKDYYKNGSV